MEVDEPEGVCAESSLPESFVDVSEASSLDSSWVLSKDFPTGGGFKSPATGFESSPDFGGLSVLVSLVSPLLGLGPVKTGIGSLVLACGSVFSDAPPASDFPDVTGLGLGFLSGWETPFSTGHAM